MRFPSPHLLLAALVSTGLAGCAIQPKPLTQQEREATVRADRGAMYQKQEPLQGAVTLEDAMARAIKYNLDHRLKLMESAVAQRQIDLSHTELLPRLALSAGYNDRSNDLASSSRDVLTGQQTLVPSISTDRDRRSADLSLSWNVLDFGVSYFSAQQQANRVLMAEERRRKVIHLLMQQTRQAYWQAAGAQLLEGRIEPALKSAREALEDSRKVEFERLRSPLEALSYQRQLLDIVRQLEAVRDELSLAKPRLAAIMNLPPGQPFAVVLPAAFPTPTIDMAMEKLEETALLRRPELIEAEYNERITALETRKALARLFPGIELTLGNHYDSNSYLVNHHWGDIGLRVGWNLLNVIYSGTIRGLADAQHEVARTQRLALSMAVLTQVHVASLEYLARAKQYDLVRQLDTVEQRTLQLTRSGAAANAQGRLDEIRASVAAMMSQLRMYQSYGALQGAYGQVVATLGLDPLPSSVASHDLKTLGEAVRASQQDWDRAVRAGGG